MPNEAKHLYAFRPVAADDLPLIGGWLALPHAAAWWGDRNGELADIGAHIDSLSVKPLIVLLDGCPIAYLQCYDPHLEVDHPYRDQPSGTRGVDLLIGVAALIGIGHGPNILRQFAEEIFEEGAPRVIVDPHPGNRQAVRAFEKAGFRSLGPRSSIYGDVLLMARDA